MKEKIQRLENTMSQKSDHQDVNPRKQKLETKNSENLLRTTTQFENGCETTNSMISSYCYFCLVSIDFDKLITHSFVKSKKFCSKNCLKNELENSFKGCYLCKKLTRFESCFYGIGQAFCSNVCFEEMEKIESRKHTPKESKRNETNFKMDEFVDDLLFSELDENQKAALLNVSNELNYDEQTILDVDLDFSNFTEMY